MKMKHLDIVAETLISFGSGVGAAVGFLVLLGSFPSHDIYAGAFGAAWASLSIGIYLLYRIIQAINKAKDEIKEEFIQSQIDLFKIVAQAQNSERPKGY